MLWLTALSPVFMVLMVTGVTADGCQKSTLITFNTGLTPLVAQYKERKAIIPEALAETDADVLCLQEVYFGKDMAAILEETKAQYPYSFSTLHTKRKRRGASCTLMEALKMQVCQSMFCGNASSSAESAMCLKENCLTALTSLKQSCRTCLGIGGSSPADIIGKCVLGSSGRFNIPGLLLLSKTPISQKSFTYYFGEDSTMIFPTGYIKANVKNVGEVVCTHLTANMGPYFEVGLDLGSWELQQKAEIDVLKRTFGNENHILLGDLNTGPHDPARNLTGNFPNNYGALQQTGYRSPYDMAGGSCTFCGLTNPVEQGAFPFDVLIDHVMSFSPTDVEAERVLEMYEGQTLSDHYGVKIKACF